MPQIFLPDLRLHAELSGPGNGAPLVLLHALGLDSSIWDDLLPLLPPSLRILRLDLRGHGRSDTPAPPYAMGALIRDTERAMDHFRLRDAALLGLSIGGLVAQGLAVKRLDLVRALILSNTAAKIGRPETWQPRIDAVAQGGMAAITAPTLERWLGRTWATHPAEPRLRALLLHADPKGWTGCAAAISGTDFYQTTATLRLPTLAIAGANDASTPPDLVRETADLIPGHRFALMRGTGHIPPVEKPAEYAALIGQFLTDIGHA
ncbi:3-oxoadipate enol-lactonase [Paragemmobacter straminiformis]|uniref:3-oxoadipate enol-lactonase n=1 Tax=Paragemmobacter straminiformis TaxID=2045119 RepID=A0A842IBF4_9RHOB|nr:3-oxoadipate enol-lactonase [Gemmobacter straminiformis]MBC2837005.1 3-oxoadipate enol-lactonase [Gemmobacter straminiformis]